jgi:lipopolysaccharide O-acetyltransferase
MYEYIQENGLFFYLLKTKNKWHSKLYNYLLGRRLNRPVDLCIHPTADLSGLSHITVGKNFLAGKHLRMEAIARAGSRQYTPRIVIKDNVAINDFVHIGAVNHVEIGNNVLISSKTYIADHNHGRYVGNDQSDPDTPPGARELTPDKAVVIGDNVWIGEQVSILAGATIGRGSVIGANSVVAGNIPPYSIAVGAPARVIKRYDRSLKRWVPWP